jgi:diacylglycerol O-acyltransferase
MTRFLDPLDSAFVLLEVPGAAMNIGAVVELDFGDETDPQRRFERIRRNIDDRLHEIPVLTQRLVRSPLDLTWPVLVPEPQFDLDRHVRRVALPSPGTADQFDELVSEFLSLPLPAYRPLWQMLVIEGLEDGRAALALKVHHALADGVSGAETFASLFDITPEVRAPMPRSGETPASGPATSLGLARERLSQMLRDPGPALAAVRTWMTRLYDIVNGVVRVTLRRGRHAATPGQPSIFEARRCSLNAQPAQEKEYRRLSFSLVDVKRAAKSRGASVTDLVMSSVGGAVRRLLVDRGEQPKRDLIAFVPINVRGEGDAAALGNQISGMLVALHTDIADPEERLRAISRDASHTAGVQRSRAARIFQDVPRVLGPTLMSWGARFLAYFGLFDRLPPVANLMVSSVAGPPIPLWISGHRVLSAAPVGPLFAGFSLNVTVLGLSDHLEFGLLASAEAVPDLRQLRDHLREEVEALITTTPL